MSLNMMNPNNQASHLGAFVFAFCCLMVLYFFIASALSDYGPSKNLEDDPAYERIRQEQDAYFREHGKRQEFHRNAPMT